MTAHRDKKVHIIFDMNESHEGVSVYSLFPQEKCSPIPLNDISQKDMEHLNRFLVNLDAFFSWDLLHLTQTFSGSRYLTAVHDNILKGWKLLNILKFHHEVCLVVGDRGQVKLWTNFLAKNGVQVTKSDNRRSPKALLRAVRDCVMALFRVSRDLYWAWGKKQTLFKWTETIFIHWVFEKDKSVEDLVKTSSYFGKVIQFVAEQKDISILGHVPEGHRNYKEIIQTCFPFIKDKMTFLMVVWSFWQSLKLLALRFPKIYFSEIDFSVFVKKSFQQDAVDGSFLKTLFFYKCFKKCLEDFPLRAKVIYPFENQPWERALLMARKEVSRAVELIGYQFSPFPVNFLIHRFSDKAMENKWISDKILTSDHATQSLFEGQNIPVCPVGSARFGDLLNQKLPSVIGKKILCSLFLDGLESLELTRKVVEISRLTGIDCILNYHPLLAKDIQNTLGKMVIGTKVTLSSERASNLLNDSFLMIYNSSSVFLEAALRGVPTLHLEVECIPNLDRFHGRGKSMNHVEDAVLFVRKLVDNEDFYHAYALEVHKKANEFIIPLNKEKIKETIS